MHIYSFSSLILTVPPVVVSLHSFRLLLYFQLKYALNYPVAILLQNNNYNNNYYWYSMIRNRFILYDNIIDIYIYIYIYIGKEKIFVQVDVAEVADRFYIINWLKSIVNFFFSHKKKSINIYLVRPICLSSCCFFHFPHSNSSSVG